MLGKDLIEMIFKADGDEEYSVQDDPITAELLEDGLFLKRAIGICNRNRTQPDKAGQNTQRQLGMGALYV